MKKKLGTPIVMLPTRPFKNDANDNSTMGARRKESNESIKQNDVNYQAAHTFPFVN